MVSRNENNENHDRISYMFWDITPFIPLKVNLNFGGTCRQGRRINQTRSQHDFLAYSSTLKMEVTFSSETSIDSQRTIWRYITGDRTLHNHRSDLINRLNCSGLVSYGISAEPSNIVLNTVSDIGRRIRSSTLPYLPSLDVHTRIHLLGLRAEIHREVVVISHP
jgi:hypothetical protein